MRNGLAVFLYMVLILAPGRAALAEINIVDSLEWMTLDTPLIVRGQAMGLEDTKGPGSVIYRDVTIAVSETLKGQPADKTIQIRLRLFTEDKTALDWQPKGHSYLFFLCRGRAEDDKDLAGWWVLRENRQSIIDFDRPQRVYTADLKRAKDAAAILGTVRAWAVRKARHGYDGYVGEPNIFKPQAGYLRLEIPWGAEFYSEVYAGSACYINVPADEKYRPLARRKAQSNEYSERAEGAAMLRNFPGPETVILLSTMLDDPDEAQWRSGRDQLVNITYPARQAAYEALVALGENPDKPVFERKPTEAEIRKARDEQWKSSMREVLPKDWIVASIQSVTAPADWTRTAGGDGIAIECRNPKVTIEDDMVGPYHPVLTLYVMPMNWEGTSRKEDGEKLQDGSYTAPALGLIARQIYPAQYLGHDDPKNSGARRFFSSIIGHTGWENPAAQLTRYFGLSTDP